ncbi:MAG: hypothetical protein KH828_03105 [Clostridiales bacterium]|nr:hypothetical protein [Clostridiales bacterium]
MSEYQRFVSYLYEYRDNKKSQNCGFSKVEVRNHQCKLEVHMKLPVCPFTPVFRVYAFVPTDGQLLGILLGKAAYHQGTVYAGFTIPDREIGGQPYQMSDLGGLLIQSDDGRIFATAWKEIPIQPDHFFLPEAAPQIHAASMEEKEPLPEVSVSEVSVSEIPPSEASVSETSTSEVSMPEEAVRRYPLEYPPETLPSICTEPSCPLNIKPAADSPVHPPETISAKRWRKIQETYPHTQPFFDDEIHQCVKLSLKDIPNLTQYNLYIGSNQFLSHGCQTFHHFLLGKPENGRPEEYVLAVPGIYDEKERFLAAMFGFPNFKPARNKAIRPGQFGYWYRLVY